MMIAYIGIRIVFCARWLPSVWASPDDFAVSVAEVVEEVVESDAYKPLEEFSLWSLLRYPRFRRIKGTKPSFLLRRPTFFWSAGALTPRTYARQLTTNGTENSSDSGNLTDGNLTDGNLTDGNLTEEDATEGDAVTNAFMGTMTAMGGTKIQPLLLLINGCMAAEVGKAFMEMLDDFSPDRIIAFGVATMSGFSIGTVGIQNMGFQNGLQGGVLISSVFSIAVRDPIVTVISMIAEGEVQSYLILMVDMGTTAAGSAIGLALKALCKVSNSAFIATTMMVDSWVTVAEDSTGIDIPEFLESLLAIGCMCFMVWYHSKLVSVAKRHAWKKQTGEKSAPKKKPSALKRFLKQKLAGPFALMNKLVTGLAVALGNGMNPKAKPMTWSQILSDVQEQLGIQSPKMVAAKFVVASICSYHIKSVLGRKSDVPRAQQRRVLEVSTRACNQLDVVSLRRVMYEMKDGTGDFTVVLEELYNNVRGSISAAQAAAAAKKAEEEAAAAAFKQEMEERRKHRQEQIKQLKEKMDHAKQWASAHTPERIKQIKWRGKRKIAPEINEEPNENLPEEERDVDKDGNVAEARNESAALAPAPLPPPMRPDVPVHPGTAAPKLPVAVPDKKSGYGYGAALVKAAPVLPLVTPSKKSGYGYGAALPLATALHPKVKCPKGHSLVIQIAVKSVELRCDVCSRDIEVDEEVHSCRRCDYDVCPDCYSRMEDAIQEEQAVVVSSVPAGEQAVAGSSTVCPGRTSETIENEDSPAQERSSSQKKPEDDISDAVDADPNEVKAKETAAQANGVETEQQQKNPLDVKAQGSSELTDVTTLAVVKEEVAVTTSAASDKGVDQPMGNELNMDDLTRCFQGHDLTLGTAYNVKCDRCSLCILDGADIYSCHLCGFDVCTECYNNEHHVSPPPRTQDPILAARVPVEDLRKPLEKMNLEDVDALWAQAKFSIQTAIFYVALAKTKRAVASESNLNYSNEKDRAYLDRIFEGFDLLDLAKVLKMIDSRVFTLSDLRDMAWIKSDFCDEGMTWFGGKDGGRSPLDRSYDGTVWQLCNALIEIVDVEEYIWGKIPYPFGDLLRWMGGKIVGVFQAGIGMIPFIGAHIIHLFSFCRRRLRISALYYPLERSRKKNRIHKAQVCDVVRKMAASDEYADDALESLVRGISEDSPVDGPVPEVTGLLGVMLNQLLTRGPGPCREMLLTALVDYFEVDLTQAQKFVATGIPPKQLLPLGQATMAGGFPFAKCTALAKNTVCEVGFKIPISHLEKGLGEELMSFGFSSPPLVISVNVDWAAQVVQETGQKPSCMPELGDRLAFVGKALAKEMSKEEFETALKELIDETKDANPGVADPAVEIRLSRGLDIDFAEQFRIVIPSVLRRMFGVPVPHGQDFARNMEMNHMKRLMGILINGGIKKLDDMSTELGVGDNMNFHEAFRADLAKKLVQSYGFTQRGATRFATHLDPAHGNFAVRMKQMFGKGDLEKMSQVMAHKDINLLEQVHAQRFLPRVQLNEYLGNINMEKEGVRANVAKLPLLGKKREFELWKDGKPLGPISEDTFAVVLGFWREYLTLHAANPVLGIAPFSSKEPLDALVAARKEYTDPDIADRLFKWPESIIERARVPYVEVKEFACCTKESAAEELSEAPATKDFLLECKSKMTSESSLGAFVVLGSEPKRTAYFMEGSAAECRSSLEGCLGAVTYIQEPAPLSEHDEEVAKKLFFKSIEEAREDVWAKYRRRMIAEAVVVLGPPKNQSASKDSASAAGSEVGKSAVGAEDQPKSPSSSTLSPTSEVTQWMNLVIDAINEHVPGAKRKAPLLKIEKAVRERDTFRLQKIAKMYGVSAPVPVSGLQAQLQAELAALPIDITAQADELASFISASNNPLTGGGKAKPKPKAKSGGDQDRLSSGDGTPLRRRDGPGLAGCDVESISGLPELADVEAPRHKRAALQSAGRHACAPPGGGAAPKMKDLFKLAQKGDFEALSSFTANSSPDMSAEKVGATMRVQCSKGLSTGFGIAPDTAEKAVESLVPAIYQLIEDFQVSTQPPDTETGTLESDGVVLKKKTRVAVVETCSKILGKACFPVKGDGMGPADCMAQHAKEVMEVEDIAECKAYFLENDKFTSFVLYEDKAYFRDSVYVVDPDDNAIVGLTGVEIVRAQLANLDGAFTYVKDYIAQMSRPVTAWLPMDTLERIEDADETLDRAMNQTSLTLRSVKNYNLTELQEMSDEFGWDLLFVDLARTRIRLTLLEKSSDFSEKAIQKSLKSKGPDDLKQCLAAIVRSDFDFVIDTLELPPPPPKQIVEEEEEVEEEEQVFEKPAEVVALEKQVARLEAKLEETKTSLKLEQTECKRLRAELEECTGKYEEKIVENTELNEELEESRTFNRTKELEEECAKLKKAVADAEEKRLQNLADARAEHSRLQIEIDELKEIEKDRDQLREELAKEKAQKEVLETQHRREQEEHMKTKKKLQGTEVELNKQFDAKVYPNAETSSRLKSPAPGKKGQKKGFDEEPVDKKKVEADDEPVDEKRIGDASVDGEPVEEKKVDDNPVDLS